jgi:hypothetical protein
MRLSIPQEPPRIIIHILDIEMFPAGMLDSLQEMNRLLGLLELIPCPLLKDR